MKLPTGRTPKIVLSVLLLGIVVLLADWREVLQEMLHIHPGWFLVAIALAGTDRLIINQRWRRLLAGRGIDIGFVPLARIQMRAGFLGSFLPTSIGVDALRIAGLCRIGHPLASVIAATLMDRITLVLGTLLVGTATLLLFAGRLVSGVLTETVLALTALMLAAAAAGAHPAVRGWIAGHVRRRLPAVIGTRVHDIGRAMSLYRHQRALLAEIAVLTALALFVRILFVAAIARSVGAVLAVLSLASIVPILWIVVMLPITIGGLGVQDMGYVGLLGAIGVTPAMAVSMSLIEHVIARVGNLPGAFVLHEDPRAAPAIDAGTPLPH